MTQQERDREIVSRLKEVLEITRTEEWPAEVRHVLEDVLATNESWSPSLIRARGLELKRMARIAKPSLDLGGAA